MKYQKIIKTPQVYAFCHQNVTATQQHLSDVLKEILICYLYAQLAEISTNID